KRGGKGQRHSGGRVIGSGDGGWRGANELPRGAIEIRVAAFRRGHVVRGGHGLIAGSEPGAPLANGAPGICWGCQFVDNEVFIPRLGSLYLRPQVLLPIATFRDYMGLIQCGGYGQVGRPTDAGRAGGRRTVVRASTPSLSESAGQFPVPH